MALINCKVELKHKWTKYCVLTTSDADNVDVNPNNFIFTNKDINFLAKGLKFQFIGMNLKQKVRTKMRQMNIDIF